MNSDPHRFYFHLMLPACYVFFINLFYSQTAAANPNSHYLNNGTAVSPWNIAVGSQSNWYVPLKNGEAKTKDKQLTIVAENDKEKGNVIRAKWSGRKGRASLQISGKELNLKTLEDKAAILITMKLNKSIKKPLALSIDCTYPCRATLQLKPRLEKYPVKVWFTLTVPLKWFANAGTNLERVNAPLNLQTAGKLDISLSSVTLILLPEGEKGCVE